LIRSGLPFTELTEVMRSSQALASNAIPVLAKDMNSIMVDSSFEMIECHNQLTRYKKSVIPNRDMIDDNWLPSRQTGHEAHILCMKKEECEAINLYIAKQLGFLPEQSNAYSVPLKKGLKVQILSTSYMNEDVFKRDLYIIKKVTDSKDGEVKGQSTLLLDPWQKCRACQNVREPLRCRYCKLKTITGSSGDISDDVKIAYATTVYTMQGGEADHIYVLAISRNCIYTDRHSWYTAMTRAQIKCTMFSEPGGLQRIVHNKQRDLNPRISILGLKLKTEM
jgi:hypothetical protein